MYADKFMVFSQPWFCFEDGYNECVLFGICFSMAQMLVKNIPLALAKKLQHATEVSYDDFVGSIEDTAENFSIRFNPPIDAKQLLKELQSYDG